MVLEVQARHSSVASLLKIIGTSTSITILCRFIVLLIIAISFWGVFWVDGSSRPRIKQTFAQNVSSIAGVEANEHAALHWLSNLSEPWLLIIDNADDHDLKLDEYFPRGNRGHILITTRDPLNKLYGTIGDTFFEFQGLKTDEARCLLLTAAGEKQPWNSTLFNIATTIAKTLGYLALAITHAGKTIRQGYCKLHEYLEFYERQWKKTRQRRQAVKTRDAADDLGVFATFDLNRQALEIRDTEASRDALQLLDTFAFLHNQNIRFEILSRAVTNSEVEFAQQEQDKEKEAQTRADSPPCDWPRWWKKTAFAVLAFIYESRSPPVLPSESFMHYPFLNVGTIRLMDDRLSALAGDLGSLIQTVYVQLYGSSRSSH